MTDSKQKLVAAVLLLVSCGFEAIPLRGQNRKHEPLTFDILMMLLISASRERFRPIMTYRVEMRPRGDSWYQVKYSLPEADSCRVYEQPALIYVCEWSPKRKQAFIDFVKRCEKALGPGWKRIDGDGRSKSTLFAAVEDRREGTIEITESAAGLRFVMHAKASE